VFENRVPRRISEPKMDYVIGGLRKLYNEEPHNLCNYNDKVKEGEMSRVGSTHKRDVYRVLVGKPEGKRPVGRPRRRWEDTIKMELREIGWGGMNWIDLAQDRDQWRALVNTLMNIRVP
jgi:hypothetical protein